MQEAADADLLIHVVDGSSPEYPEQIEQVQSVLREIGAADVPQLLLFNKIDLLDESQRPLRALDHYQIDGVQLPRVFASAMSGEGLDLLRQELARLVVQRERAALTAEQSPNFREDSL